MTTLQHFTSFFFFFNDTATTEIYTLSLHDALPISPRLRNCQRPRGSVPNSLPKDVQKARAQRLFTPIQVRFETRSEEHTSELQSLRHLVCRLLLEKKKKKKKNTDRGDTIEGVNSMY